MAVHTVTEGVKVSGVQNSASRLSIPNLACAFHTEVRDGLRMALQRHVHHTGALMARSLRRSFEAG